MGGMENLASGELQAKVLHGPQQIARRLREAEAELAVGSAMPEAGGLEDKFVRQAS